MAYIELVQGLGETLVGNYPGSASCFSAIKSKLPEGSSCHVLLTFQTAPYGSSGTPANLWRYILWVRAARSSSGLTRMEGPGGVCRGGVI